MAEVIVSIFKGKANHQGETKALAWDVLKRNLTALGAGRIRRNKDGLLISFTAFKDNYAKKDAALNASGVVVDFDNNEAESKPDDVLGEIEGKAHAYHSTHSTTPTKLKWRLYVPVDRALLPEEYPIAVDGLIRVLGTPAGVDRTCREVARMHYLPAVQPEFESSFVSGSADGAFFSSDELIEWGGGQAAVALERAGIKRQQVVTVAPLADKQESEVKEGGRNAHIFRFTCALIGDKYKPEHIMPLVKLHNSKVCKPPLSDSEVLAVVDNALKNYKPGGGKSEQLRLATALVDSYGAGCLVYTQGSFWFWDNTGVWKMMIDDLVAKRLATMIPDSISSGKAEGIVKLCRILCVDPSIKFNADTTGINVQNGTLRWDGTQFNLAPHRKEDFRTIQLPIAYDANAKAPRFKQFLHEIFDAADTDENEEFFEQAADSDNKVLLIEEAFGYTLLGDCRFEKGFWLLGEGANGKSVLLRTLCYLLGTENYTTVPVSALEDKFKRGNLFGKLANVVYEIAASEDIPDGALKTLISGEPLTAEQKYKDPFTFTPFAKLWFAANSLSFIKDLSKGFFRRIIPIEFKRQFDGATCDRGLVDKLRAELPGILNVSLTGLARLLTRGEFTESTNSKKVLRTWRTDSDQAAQFAEEVCKMETDLEVSKSDIWRRYGEWAETAGIHKRLTRRSLMSRLCNLPGVREARTSTARVLRGITVVDEYGMN
jgi:P4 family phage/plasmid primase-like protien